MKIGRLSVKNFRSLKEIDMLNLQTLTILIGENSSGKTNIFEAMDLFFNYFDYHHKQPRGSLTDESWYLWFDGNIVEPIELKITLQGLSNEQRRKIANVANIKQQRGDLVVHRSIISENGNLVYRNDYIEWGDLAIRSSDTGYTIEFGAEFDPNLFAQAIDENIIKNAFNYMPISRGEELSKPHGSILARQVRQELIREGGDITPKGMKEWNITRGRYKTRGWTPEQFECRGNRLLFPCGNTSIPYELVGSGHQALLNLFCQIESGGPIVAIEEPENHLHPYLQKILVREFRELFGTKKQIWVATHSPFMIDLVNLNSVWFVYKDGLESKVINVSTTQGINDVIWRLGVRPSDFLFANGVLIVEGPTDADIYADWARKIGMSLDAVGIYIIDAEGVGKIKNYLKSEIVRRTSFKSYCLCDKDSEDKLREAVQGIAPDENIFVLGKGDLEDYFPRQIVQEFAKQMAIKKNIPEEEIPTEIKVGYTVKTLDKLLGGDWWKTQLAKIVKRDMRPSEVEKEIESKLTQIYQSIY